MSSFVSVGNALQPFARLLDGVAACAHLLPQPVLVQHGHTPFAAPGCTAEPFLPMAGFEAAVAAADLVILHAGAGSVIHAIAAGKRPVVMPRRQHLGEHIDDHQLEFARALAASGRAVMAETADELPRAIAEALAGPAGPGGTRGGAAMLALVETTLTRYASDLTNHEKIGR